MSDYYSSVARIRVGSMYDFYLIMPVPVIDVFILTIIFLL